MAIARRGGRIASQPRVHLDRGPDTGKSPAGDDQIAQCVHNWLHRLHGHQGASKSNCGISRSDPTEWSRYTHRFALGQGEALIQDCGCATPTYAEHYPARVVLSKARRCRSNPQLEHFARAKLTVSIRPKTLSR